jgi:hypothetical protein
LATFRGRFVSREQFFYAFAASVIVVQVWAILNLLKELPAWILRLSLWELAGVIAYTQAFALLESLLITGVLVVLAALLPARLFRERFVSLSATLVTLAAIWAIFIHYNDKILQGKGGLLTVLWLVAMLASFVLAYLLVLRFPKVDHAITNFMQRASVLAMVYVFVGIASFLIVIARNL